MSKRVSLHDRDDADGITDAGAAKTAGVVDVLIAPDVAAGDDRIVHIPVGKIVPHPRNRKILDEDVADLVASLNAGARIVNPIGVTAAADWNAGKPDDLQPIQSDEFIITGGGHRRLRAAELVKFTTVPCIIRADAAGVTGRLDALVENVQRRDLDEFEEAAAYFELTQPPYKMSQRDIAKVAGGVNQSHISKRLKLLKLPEYVRELVRTDPRLGTIAGLEFARVAEQPDLLQRAVDLVQHHHYGAASAVDRIIADHERESKVKAVRDELTAKGIRIVDQRPAWMPAKRALTDVVNGLELAESKHRKEPCHAVYVDDFNGRTIPACSAPERHMDDGESKLKVKPDVAADITERPARGHHDETARLRRQLKKIEPARAEFIRSILIPIGCDFADELVNRGLHGHVFGRNGGAADVARVVLQILGVEPEKGAYPPDVVRRFEHTARTTPERSTVDANILAVVTAAAYFEGSLRLTHHTWGDSERWWLDQLVRYGYELTDVERETLTYYEELTKNGDDGEPERECRTCESTEADFEPGVTWIEPDLCSACSDAKDAGWLAEQAAAAGTTVEELGESIPEQTESDPVNCPACGGTGDAPDYADTSKMCERCNGDGLVDAGELDAVSA